MMAAGEYELAVAPLQEHFRARRLALMLGPRTLPGVPREDVLLLHLLRGLQEPSEQGAPLPAPSDTWIEDARLPVDLQYAISVAAEAYVVRHGVAALRSLWQQVFAQAGLVPTQLHIAAGRLAFLGLGQLASLGWDGQLAAVCGRVYKSSEDHRHCFEPLGSVLHPEKLVIAASEVQQAFGLGALTANMP